MGMKCGLIKIDFVRCCFTYFKRRAKIESEIEFYFYFFKKGGKMTFYGYNLRLKEPFWFFIFFQKKLFLGFFSRSVDRCIFFDG